MSDGRLRIFRGQDKAFLIRVTNKESKDPYTLVGATLIQVIFEKEDRTKLVLSTINKPAVKALGYHNQVAFIALVAGVEGNGITLEFNGVSTYDEVVEAWNIANPTNGVEHHAEDGSDVPEAGTLTLEGGYPAYTPVSVWGAPEIGKIQVVIAEKETHQLRAGIGKSFTLIVDKGENPAGNRNVTMFEQKVDIKEANI